jgi:hypothetical protein
MTGNGRIFLPDQMRIPGLREWWAIQSGHSGSHNRGLGPTISNIKIPRANIDLNFPGTQRISIFRQITIKIVMASP